VSFEIRFEGSVSVDSAQMQREKIPKRRASMPKTREKRKVDAWLK